jgi:translation initiation factor 2B subunit (eIF-2B alpha/beta/delta family)
MRREIVAAVDEIRGDRERGSRQLALVALESLADIAPTATLDEWLESARALAEARPAMTAIANAAALAWESVRQATDAGGAIETAVLNLDKSGERMAKAALALLPAGTLMTYSYSSAVLQVLAAVRPRRVIVSESRPLYEGLRAARAVVDLGVSVTLITESQFALFVPEAEAVIVGADAVFPDGSFANKVGTKLLALAARDARVSFYVTAETLKVASPSTANRWQTEEGLAGEVSREKKLDIRNVYFETTPAALVTAFITEQGILEPPLLKRFSRVAERRLRSLMA